MSTKDLREISKKNDVLFQKDEKSVKFANDCGTAIKDSKNITLRFEGKIKLIIVLGPLFDYFCRQPVFAHIKSRTGQCP